MKKEEDSSQGLNGVLIPILTEKEHEDRFIERIKEHDKAVLLFVIDEKLKEVPAGFVGSRIKSAENEIDRIKSFLPGSILVKEYIEWGSWSEKVENTAKLEQCSKVLMASSREAELIRPFLKSAGIGFEIISFEE